MSRARWNNLLAATDLRIGATQLDQLTATASGQKMMLGGDAVWPADQAYDPNDGSAFREFMRALASQYDGSLYVDWAGRTNASDLVGTPNWNGFGVSAIDARTVGRLDASLGSGEFREPEGSPASTGWGIPSSLLKTDADSLFGTWPWLAGGSASASLYKNSYRAQVRFDAPNSKTPGNHLVAGVLRVGSFEAGGVRGGTGKTAATIGWGDEDGWGEAVTNVGIYIGRVSTRTRGWPFSVLFRHGTGEAGINEVTRGDLSSVPLDLPQGAVGVFVMNMSDVYWKPVDGVTTAWNHLSMSNPQQTDIDAVRRQMRFCVGGFEDSVRYGFHDVAWGMFLNDGGDQIDLVKDAWDRYGA